MDAYQYSILIEFADKIIQRVFPRFFAYMADYPEKYARQSHISRMHSDGFYSTEYFWRAYRTWATVRVCNVLLKRHSYLALELRPMDNGGENYGKTTRDTGRGLKPLGR